MAATGNGIPHSNEIRPKPADDLNPNTWLQIRRMARRLVQNAGFLRGDQEDIEQRMALRVIQKRPSYDPKRATWTGFVALILDREASSILRRLYAQKRDYRRLTSLDATACKHKRDGCNSALIDADQRMIERTDLALDLAECETRLPASLQALSDDLRTLSISEAARKANLPRSTLRDRALKLRSVYKRAGLDIYLPE